MDGEDDEDPGGEYSPTLDYLVVTATSFLSSLLRSDDHVRVSTPRSTCLERNPLILNIAQRAPLSSIYSIQVCGQGEIAWAWVWALYCQCNAVS